MLKKFFIRRFAGSTTHAGPDSAILNRAMACLLVEVALADGSLDIEETDRMRSRIARISGVAGDLVDELINDACHRVDDAVSLYPFTRDINDHASPDEKAELLGAMWAVAAADGRIDPLEDHLIRKVADLLYVSHSEFIRQKLRNVEAD